MQNYWGNCGRITQKAWVLKRDSNTGAFLWILKFFNSRVLQPYQKKKKHQRRCFPVNIAIFLPILMKACERPLLHVSRSDYLTENTSKRLFLSNCVQFNDFNCLILFKDTKIQSFDLLFKILLYFINLLISY